MELLAEHANLLKLVGENLRLGSSESPSPEPQITRVRSSSSSYPSKGIRSTQSPVSELPLHTLSLSNLSQFSHSNRRLSQLHSSSTSSKQRSVSTSGSTQEAIAEAAAVITQWQGERERIVSYGRYKLNSSAEILPEDSTSQQVRLGSEESSTRSSAEPKPPRYSEVMAIKNQYDGVGDAPHPESPLPSAYQRMGPQGTKRKASQFSLRSLSKPFAKRPRLEIKRLASNAYRGSTRQFSRARESMRRQHEEETKQYAAWKALRRRNKPGDAIKGKIEKGFGSFSIERSRYGHKMWWKEGVEKYHAPEWMRFGSSFKMQK